MSTRSEYEGLRLRGVVIGKELRRDRVLCNFEDAGGVRSQGTLPCDSFREGDCPGYPVPGQRFELLLTKEGYLLKFGSLTRRIKVSHEELERVAWRSIRSGAPMREKEGAMCEKGRNALSVGETAKLLGGKVVGDAVESGRRMPSLLSLQTGACQVAQRGEAAAEERAESDEA